MMKFSHRPQGSTARNPLGVDDQLKTPVTGFARVGSVGNHRMIGPVADHKQLLG